MASWDTEHRAADRRRADARADTDRATEQSAGGTVSSMTVRTIQTECPRAAGPDLRRRGTAGPPPVRNRRRRGADLVEQPRREIARALVGREAPTGGPEEADAQPGAPREADELNRALDRAAHDLCLRHGLRESSEPASGTERPPACPSAFKEYADTGTSSELGGCPFEGSNVAHAPPYGNLSHPVENLRQQRVLP